MLAHGAPALARLAGAGLDFIRLDMEHTPVDDAVVARLVHEAESLPIDICLRPASGRPADLERALATGARRLCVPQVETAQQALSIVEAVYQLLPDGTPVHLEVMHESPEAFQNCEAIAGVEGVDLLVIGPADLAQELGISGTPDEEEKLDKYRYLLAEAAIKHGKPWEIGVWTRESALRWAAEGCPVLMYMTDTSALQASYSPALAEMERLAGGR
jgi:2-keto-3-deoxy-L-rhamnonate aldolase RhmA